MSDFSNWDVLMDMMEGISHIEEKIGQFEVHYEEYLTSTRVKKVDGGTLIEFRSHQVTEDSVLLPFDIYSELRQKFKDKKEG